MGRSGGKRAGWWHLQHRASVDEDPQCLNVTEPTEKTILLSPDIMKQLVCMPTECVADTYRSDDGMHDLALANMALAPARDEGATYHHQPVRSVRHGEALSQTTLRFSTRCV